MKRAWILAAPILALAGGGCGDGSVQTCTGTGDPDALAGSYCEGSEISFDSVELGWFASAQTLRVRYGRLESDAERPDSTRVSPRFEMLLLGSRVVLEAGVDIPIRDAGFVRRWPEGASEPQILTEQLESSSSIVFDSLTLEAGGQAAGRFDLLFENGRTLRGRFDGLLVDIAVAP